MKPLAVQWREAKPEYFASPLDYFVRISALDHKADLKKTDLGIVIMFSDGSMHRMEANLQPPTQAQPQTLRRKTHDCGRQPDCLNGRFNPFHRCDECPMFHDWLKEV